jgi:hypothetical protein
LAVQFAARPHRSHQSNTGNICYEPTYVQHHPGLSRSHCKNNCCCCCCCCRRLRDDAAFKLTYYLGRVGVLTLGMAVGHPDSTLVAEAAATAAAAAAEGVVTSARGPGSCRLTAAAAAGGAGGSVVASPGRSPCGTFRGRPASAAAGSGSAAAAAGGCDASEAAHKRRPGSASSCLLVGTGLQGPTGAAGRSRPTSAATKLSAKAAAGGASGSVRGRSSSTDGSDISSAWDDPTIGVLMPSAAAADADTASSTACPHSIAAGATASAGAAAAAAGAAAAGGSGDGASQTSSSTLLTKASRAQKQKRVHVPGSGVFGPGVVAALMHVRALQASDDAGAAAAAETWCSSTGPRERIPDSRAAAPQTADSPPQGGDAAIAAASILNGPSAAAATAGAVLVAPRTSTGPMGSSRPASAAAAVQGGSCGSSSSRRPCTASTAAAAGRPGTAADVYWQRPDHSSSATGTALSGLLSTLFTGKGDMGMGVSSHRQSSTPTTLLVQSNWCLACLDTHTCFFGEYLLHVSTFATTRVALPTGVEPG